MMEERKNLLDKMRKRKKTKGGIESAVQKKERTAALRDHMDRFRKKLFESKKD